MNKSNDLHLFLFSAWMGCTFFLSQDEQHIFFPLNAKQMDWNYKWTPHVLLPKFEVHTRSLDYTDTSATEKKSRENTGHSFFKSALFLYCLWCKQNCFMLESLQENRYKVRGFCCCYCCCCFSWAAYCVATQGELPRKPSCNQGIQLLPWPLFFLQPHTDWALLGPQEPLFHSEKLCSSKFHIHTEKREINEQKMPRDFSNRKNEMISVTMIDESFL